MHFLHRIECAFSLAHRSHRMPRTRPAHHPQQLLQVVGSGATACAAPASPTAEEEGGGVMHAAVNHVRVRDLRARSRSLV